jgi:hypothetical protein
MDAAAAAPPAPDGAPPGKRAHSPSPPPPSDAAAAAVAAATTTAASPRAAAPHEAKRPRRAPPAAAADPAAAARLASVARHVAPFLPNVLDLLALREATRLPLANETLAAHLRAVGPSTLVPPWPCAYSRAQHTKLWAVVLTRYLGDWYATVVGAAVTGGAAAVADALDDIADVLSMTPLATTADGGGTPAWPDAHLTELGMGYDDAAAQESARPPLTPRLARVMGLARGGPHPGGGGGAGAGAGGTAARPVYTDPLYGPLQAAPPEQYAFLPARVRGAGASEAAVRGYAATAAMLDASEAVAATAAALRLGLTRPEQLPAPQWIGTISGRYEAMKGALRAAGVPYRNDSVLCRAFVESGCSGAGFSATCSATAGDDDACGLAYLVETMCEMRWLHSAEPAASTYRDLVASHHVYADAYATQLAYSAAVRAAKLRAARDHVAQCGETGVPHSLVRDLRRVQAEGDGCGDGPAKLPLRVARGAARAGSSGAGSSTAGKRGRGRGGGGGKRRGACFACGGHGHWAAECPYGDGYDYDYYEGY